MSLKNSKFIFLLLLGFGFCGYEYLFSKKPLPKSFSPNFNVSQFSSQGVVDRIIQLKFKTAKISDEKAEITALVSLPFDFEGELQYKWTLGQNVTLFEGNQNGLSDIYFKKDVPQQIKITVAGFESSHLRHIGFEIWGAKNGRRIFVDGLISSQQENSFEDIVQHVEKIKAKKSGIQK